MPACRLSDYTSRFSVGTSVVYIPAGGLPRVHGYIVEAPTLFGKLVETCIVRLDNGMIVPCQQLIALPQPDASSIHAQPDFDSGVSC